MMKPVLVSIVTHNDEQVLGKCLDSVFSQTAPVQIAIFDNASEDRTCHVAKEKGLEAVRSPKNKGYSHGHNRNLESVDFDMALLLNADVILRADFLERLLEVFAEIEEVGIAGGKLLRMDENGQQLVRDARPVLDSTGMYFTPTLRHFDRGNDEKDLGQYDRRQLVFGITGAALALTREFFEDIHQEGEFLDEDFFAYREDADLAWRAQSAGWKVVYEPRAVALHLRSVTPTGRRQIAPLINYHSVKNRFLMRRKNMDRAVRMRCFPYMWTRDLGILFYVLVLERKSLAALLEARRLRRKFRTKRMRVLARRRVSGRRIAWWFSFRPRAVDI